MVDRGAGVGPVASQGKEKGKVVTTEGWTAGLTSFTQLTKKEMVFVVELELSIQAIGMPI